MSLINLQNQEVQVTNTGKNRFLKKAKEQRKLKNFLVDLQHQNREKLLINKCNTICHTKMMNSNLN